MKLLFGFARNQVLFTIVYVLMTVGIIGFYKMTAGEVEVLYPICIAVFFYVCYELISVVQYVGYIRSLKRLQTAAFPARSGKREYQVAYDTLNYVNQRHNEEIAALKRKATEDKRFISAFIHNLKTPVTVESIILQRVRAGELEPLDALEQIQGEQDRLMNHLDMLLELQRIEELQNDYQPQGVILESELMQIINSNKSLFINSRVYPKLLNHAAKAQDEQRQNEVDSDEEKQVQTAVYTDSKWNRVLLNQIISNAVKYSKGEKEHYVYFTIRSEGERTSLIIQDEGVGIPEYDLPKVFDAFFTGENGRSGFHSSGIGLYLCKLICDRLGHRIKIENENGCKVTISYLSKL